MGTKTKEMQYSSALFTMNEKRTRDSLPEFVKTIDGARNQILFLKKELSIKTKYGSEKLVPEFAYEKSDEWKAYTEEVVADSYNKKIAELERQLIKVEDGLKCEKARLYLMTKKVPAWEASFDNTKLLATYHDHQQEIEVLV